MLTAILRLNYRRFIFCMPDSICGTLQTSQSDEGNVHVLPREQFQRSSGGSLRCIALKRSALGVKKQTSADAGRTVRPGCHQLNA